MEESRAANSPTVPKWSGCARTLGSYAYTSRIVHHLKFRRADQKKRKSSKREAHAMHEVAATATEDKFMRLAQANRLR